MTPRSTRPLLLVVALALGALVTLSACPDKKPARRSTPVRTTHSKKPHKRPPAPASAHHEHSHGHPHDENDHHHHPHPHPHLPGADGHHHPH